MICCRFCMLQLFNHPSKLMRENGNGIFSQKIHFRQSDIQRIDYFMNSLFQCMQKCHCMKLNTRLFPLRTEGLSCVSNKIYAQNALSAHGVFPQFEQAVKSSLYEVAMNDQFNIDRFNKQSPCRALRPTERKRRSESKFFNILLTQFFVIIYFK